MLEDMSGALDLVCQASTALASSIRKTAGWLGHADTQSACPAKLLQVCLHLNQDANLSPTILYMVSHVHFAQAFTWMPVNNQGS